MVDTCGTDTLCNFLGQFFGGSPTFELSLFEVVLYVTFSFTFYHLGSYSERTKRESFINGIMYYINIQAFNSANIPDMIDENSEEHVIEAKSRLARKIMPRVPS